MSEPCSFCGAQAAGQHLPDCPAWLAEGRDREIAAFRALPISVPAWGRRRGRLARGLQLAEHLLNRVARRLAEAARRAEAAGGSRQDAGA